MQKDFSLIRPARASYARLFFYCAIEIVVHKEVSRLGGWVQASRDDLVEYWLPAHNKKAIEVALAAYGYVQKAEEPQLALFA